MRTYHSTQQRVISGAGHSGKKNPLRKVVMKRILLSVAFFGVVGFLYAWYWFDSNVLNELPDVTQDTIEQQVSLSQSSSITDKEGNELYTLFEENRTKVVYENISPRIINALIAVEDQRFWENDGLDYLGIVRAAYLTAKNKITGNNSLQGASTLTQQLVRNFFFEKGDSFQAKLKRKLKEIVITRRLEGIVENYILARRDISGEELERAKKEKVLEWYLNLIFLGNNAYGIEAATQTYFNKPASDVTNLEAAILASIPKGPSIYEPYKRANRQRLMGGVVAEQGGELIYLSGGELNDIHKEISQSILALDITKSNDNALFLDILNGNVKRTQQINGSVYTYYYMRGRKDSSLIRMYDEGYITQEELKEGIVQGLGFEFSSPRIEIDAPHFVFWVQEFLLQNEIFADLGLTEEVLKQGGLTIKTSLNPQIQDIAEKTIILERAQLIQKGGTNRSMIHIDSTNGDVLAYVGSIDYNNSEIEGQNDMVLSPRQPGSTMKPLIYTYGFMTIPLSIDTPIYDIPFRIGSLQPGNADSSYMGPLSLRQALGYSRNIPAVKMYFAVGREEKLLPYLRDIGLTSLDGKDYGYSLALGAGEVPMLELAQAYSQLSRLGEGALINPILSITGPDGAVIYTKEIIIPKRVIPAGAAYLMRDILSDPANMPPGWTRYFTTKGIKMAIKSGTSDMKVPGDGSYPRDGWLNSYTPETVTLMRAGNANAAPMNKSAYGGFLNSNLIKSFYTDMLTAGLITNKDHKAVDVSAVSINKVNGLLMSSNTPSDFAVQTLGYNKTLPNKTDTGIEVFLFDPLCRGAVGDFTPLDKAQQGYLYTSPVSFMSSQMDANDIKQWFLEGSSSGDNVGDVTRQKRVDYSYPNIFVIQPTISCPTRLPIQNLNIRVTFDVEGNTAIGYDLPLSFGAISSDGLSKIEVKIGEALLYEEKITGTSYSNEKVFRIDPEKYSGLQTLMVTAYDEKNHFNSRAIRVTLSGKDTTSPLLDDVSVKETSDGYDVTFTFLDASDVLGGNIKIGGEIYEFMGKTTTINVKELDIAIYDVSDREQNIGQGEYDLRQ